jgi:uncharacterized protein (UPF0335 family)
LTTTSTVQPERLAGFVTEIERAEHSIADATTDRSEILKAAKQAGFNTTVLRKVIADRRKPVEERQAEESLYAAYWRALQASGTSEAAE